MTNALSVDLFGVASIGSCGVLRPPLRVSRSIRLMLSLALVAAAGTAARPAPARADGPWPLGTLQVVSGQVNGCPREFQCENMQILNCPNVMLNQYGAIAESDPVGPARGVVVFIDGGGANEWWADVGTSGETFQWHLRDDDHFVIMELRFAVGWAVSEPGEQTGPAHVACRPATTIKWIHDNVYLPLGLHPWAGQCGFCVTGNSGGASAVAYGLPFYGLDTILDADIPTGGPDHAAITKACLEVPGYEYNDNHRHSIDNSYGYYNQPLNPGPCFNEDPTWAPTWDADSIDIGGNDYDHPNTRVEFIEGGLDDTGAPAHGADYRQRLLQDPANHVTWTFIPTMPHHISTDPNGQAAIEASLLKAIGPVTTIGAGLHLPGRLRRAGPGPPHVHRPGDRRAGRGRSAGDLRLDRGHHAALAGLRPDARHECQRPGRPGPGHLLRDARPGHGGHRPVDRFPGAVERDAPVGLGGRPHGNPELHRGRRPA